MLTYTYTHKVQYYETDQMKIVHHSNYIRWFEEARCALLSSVGCGYEVVEQLGIVSPVLQVQADYKTMTSFGETVHIETAVSYYNGFRLNFTYTIRDSESGTVRCTGESKHCFLDQKGGIVNLRKAAPELHAKMMTATAEEA